jgi:hypothetical protein
MNVIDIILIDKRNILLEGCLNIVLHIFVYTTSQGNESQLKYVSQNSRLHGNII